MPLTYTSHSDTQVIEAWHVDELRTGLVMLSKAVANVLEAANGAVGDNSTNDTQAFLNANTQATASAILVPGTATGTGYRWGANGTLTRPITILPGGALNPDTGVTVTLNGPLHAGPYQIFSGAGTIVFCPGSYGDGVKPVRRRGRRQSRRLRVPARDRRGSSARRARVTALPAG